MIFSMDIFLLISLLALLLILYTSVIYPLIIIIVGKFVKENSFKKKEVSDDELPTVSVIIAAYNEEEFIRDCIISVLESDYPNEKINVIAGSDGSNDNTYEIMSELSEKYNNLTVFNFERSGKNRVLNQLCKNINSELILYMDADIRLDSNTLKKAVSYFHNDKIGAVICGMNSEDLKSNDDAGKEGESYYQKYEDLLRINETKLGTTVASLGAFYGIRAKNYKPLPDYAVLDDLMPLINTAIKGENIIYLHNNRVREVRPKSGSDEFLRKIRISAAGFATLWHFRYSIDRLFNKYGFFMLSHKLLRWSIPLLLLTAIVSSFFISSHFTRNIFLLSEILLFLFAVVGYIFEKVNINIKLFRFAMIFLSINISFFIGFLRFIVGGKISLWSRNN
jgi:biofilm PGA synthesis N-glycosyltransferase PgaC